MDTTDESPAAELKVELVQLSKIRPCPENDITYKPLSMDDPDTAELIKSIRANGIVAPIHISADNVIISRHRRRFCALQAGLSVIPVIRNEISYRDDPEAFQKLLVEHNTQRKKTAAMLMREEAQADCPSG